MKIVAIDPGMTGAAAVLEQYNGSAVVLHEVMDLPVSGDGPKKRLDAPTFARWLLGHAPTVAFIEAARPMSKQGVSSTFRYGRVCGALEGIVAACGVPLVMVESNTWKRFMRLDSNKENARARAILLLPSAASELQRVKDHNRAESILLGLYGFERGMAA